LSSTQFPEQFSDCSLEQLSVFLDNANPSCLLDTPSSSRLYSGSVCGNAFLDPGEQCDCGTAEECENPCCDPVTCRLTEGSQCAHGDCCENCQIKDAESVCRASVNECDVPEYCTGQSEQCPENDFKMNGIPCSSGQGYCYNGQCPTHLQHCQRLWGTGKPEFIVQKSKISPSSMTLCLLADVLQDSSEAQSGFISVL
ncbi:hypothetical protein cypCar_00038414, partial [Cyprinus carpio]